MSRVEYNLMPKKITGDLGSTAYFTIDNLPLNTPDTFYFIDDQGCRLLIPLDIGDCSCISESGMMNSTLQAACENSAINVSFDGTNLILDANDSLRFIAHTRSDDTLGLVVAISADLEFLFTDGPFLCDSTYYVSAVVGNWTGTDISTADPCLDVSPGQPIRFDCDANADAGRDTSLCATTVNLTGNSTSGSGSWSTTSGTISLTTINDSTANAVFPGPGMFSFQYTTSNGSCTSSDEMIVTVHGAPEIIVSTIEFICNDDNDMYSVRFELMGGDITSLISAGTSTGAFAAGVFTSDLIPSGSAYNFIIRDQYNCGDAVLDGTFDCPCLSQVGELTPSDTELCESEVFDLTSLYDSTIEFLDGNDVKTYILSSDNTDLFGSIIQSNSTGSFTFDETSMSYATPYYAFVVVGDGPSTVDLTDLCLSQSLLVSILWYDMIDGLTIDAVPIEITCLMPQVSLSVNTSDDFTGYGILWTASPGVIFPGDETSPTARVSAAGQYTVTLSAPVAGCDAEASITINESDDLPTILIQEPAVITCDSSDVAISALGSSAGSEFAYSWSGPGILGASDGISIRVDMPGQYTFTVENTDNGCERSQSVDVIEDRELPAAVIVTPEKFSCNTTSLTLSGLGSFEGVDAVYMWSVLSVNGNIIGPINERDIVVDEAGSYALQVTNRANGCQQTVNVLVEVEDDVITGFLLSQEDPSCAGVDDGTIEVIEIMGGVAPYLYSFDGGTTFVEASVANNLPPGDFVIVVKDQNECVWEEMINLVQPVAFGVNLGPDLILSLGEEVNLTAITNLPDSQLASITWLPLLDSANQNTGIQDFIPAVGTQVVVVEIANNGGCIESDDVRINVRFEKRIYIPNVLRLNGQILSNSLVNIFADPLTVASINTFEIYDRWGGKVFERSNVPVSLVLNPEYAWDGRVNEKEVEQGAYAFYAEVEYVTGVTEVVSGNIHVLK